MVKLKELIPVIDQHIGEYILLGGLGLLDGMKNPDKASVVKIVGFYDNAPHFKQYRRRIPVYIPERYWEQEFRFVSKKEYKKLPVYYGF